MARRKAGDSKVRVGNVSRISGKVTIAGGDVYEGYTVEQVSLLLKEITTGYRRKPFDGQCPYKGLEVFEEEDADLFFGRERLVEDLVNRVKDSRTMFITGPSGSGKSSLVRAGLIHALKKGQIKGSDRWLYETMKPGREPIKELSLAFSRLKSPELAHYFLAHANDINVLNECVESVLSGRKDQRFVLFVDQFEEVFTQIGQEEQRQAFINMLAHAGTVESGRITVLFAMRSDFVSNCATYPRINELLSQEFRQIGAMQPDELVAAIALPAKVVGLPIEEELIARIINDMEGEPGALPLMQFALKDLFDAQQAQGGVIALTLEDYLKHGGIQKSLERHADASLAALDEEGQTLARSIFRGLIEIGRGTQDTKRTALFEELVPVHASTQEVLAIVQKLADARLIITDQQAGQDTVTISHEKLIEAWPWLKKLVNENRDVITLQNEIASDAKEWEDHRRDPSYLYVGARLANVRAQLDIKMLDLSSIAQQFVDKGIELELAARQEEERRRQKELKDALKLAEAEAKRAEEQTHSAKTLKQRSIYLTVALVASLIATILAAFFGFQSRKQTRIALARQLATQVDFLDNMKSPEQITKILLAIRSMQLFPLVEMSQVLQNSTLAYPISYLDLGEDVRAVAFSPDGEYVVTGSWDKTARVWDAETGKEVARMIHDGFVSSVAFSPDGRYVASGSLDGTASVWEAATGTEISRIIHDDGVKSVAFSPNGQYIVLGGQGQCVKREGQISCSQSTARVWEITTSKEITGVTFVGDVSSVGFSPDGKFVVSAGCEKLAKVYDCVESTARVWDATTSEEIARTTFVGDVSSVAFSSDGKFVVSAGCEKLDSQSFCTQGIAMVWETLTSKEIARMTHESFVESAAFSPDGESVVSGSWDRTARVWEAATGKEIARMLHDGSVNSVAFSPDGKYVVSGSSDKTARVWEAATGKEIARMIHDLSVESVTFSPNGEFAVSGSMDNTARVWAIQANLSGYSSAVPINKFDILFECEKYEPAQDTTNGTCVQRVLRIIEKSDYLTRREVARMPINGPMGSAQVSPDGKYVISQDGDNRIYLWDPATGNEITHMTHDDHVLSFAFSPDSQYVVTGSRDRTARVWETLSGKEKARMTHQSSVNAVAFSPEGKYVVSAEGEDFDISQNNSVHVWEAITGEETIHITNDYPVQVVAFSHDSRYVVAGGSLYLETCENDDLGCFQGVARVWEVSNGKEISHIRVDDSMLSVYFSEDDKYVITNFDRLWLWRAADLIADACSRVTRNLSIEEWKQYFHDDPYRIICPNLPIETKPAPTETKPALTPTRKLFRITITPNP